MPMEHGRVCFGQGTPAPPLGERTGEGGRSWERCARGLPVPYGYRMADTILQARACGGSREIRLNPLCRKFMPRNAFGFGRAGEVFASSPARAAARRQGNGPYQGWARSRAHPIDSPLLWKRALSAEAEPCKKSGRPDRYRMAWSRSRFCCFAQERYGNLRRLTGSPW